MITKKLTVIAIFLIAITTCVYVDYLPEISVFTNDNQPVDLIPEPLDTFKEIPIRNSRDRINEKYQNPDFFSLYMLNLNHVKNNDLVKIKIKNGDIPVRISFLSIDQKTTESDRVLISHGSTFLDVNKELEAETYFFHYQENMNFMIAERVDHIDQISEMVKSLKTVKDKGYHIKIDYGTNWTMSDLNLEFDILIEKNKNHTGEITLDELIDAFASPQWVIAIRTSQIK